MLQCLDEEVGPHARVVGIVDVEDTGGLDPHAVLAVVVEEQRLGASLALVAAGLRPQLVDVAAAILGLRLKFQIAP